MRTHKLTASSGATQASLTATIAGVTTEYQGFLSIRRYEIEEDRHSGGRQRVVRFVMERGHAVGVLAFDPQRDRIVLVNELRPGILVAGGPAFSDSLIAGTIGDGENALEAAVRETREEAGLELRGPRVVIERAFVSPGGTSESITLVYGVVSAPRASEVHGNIDEAENIRTTILSARQFIGQVRGGQIEDMKTILAGYWLMANRARLRREQAAAHPERKPLSWS
jgi:ADP-ribose pyrophosphatase